MRPVKACLQCRTGKRRCDWIRDSACSQCLQRNLSCSAAIPASQSPTAAQPLPPIISTRSREEVIHLVDLYFRFIHNQPHSLFHMSTFKASVVAGTVSQPVLLSMIGMSARYNPDQHWFLTFAGLVLTTLQIRHTSRHTDPRTYVLCQSQGGAKGRSRTRLH